MSTTKVRSSGELIKLMGMGLIIIGGIVAVGLLQKPQLNILRKEAKTPSSETLEKQLEMEKIRLDILEKTPAFGFDNLLADWVFLDYLEYGGDEEARNLTGYGLTLDYFDVIVNHDPRFRQIYSFLAIGGSIDVAMPEKSVELMEEGLEFMSPTIPEKSYLVWRYKALIELLYLGDSEAAKESYNQAAEWASVYPDRFSRNVGILSRRTAEFLENNPDSKWAQISSWATVLQEAVDDRTRETAVRRIQQLGGKIVVTPEGRLQVIPPEED